MDSTGNLFIVGFSNQRIRKVDTLGTITTVAGNGTFGFSGDGGPQMTDAAERESFLALLGQKNSRKRAELAEAFLVAYPRSAFLAQVYEIASKSYIDLGNYNRALRYAEDSLKLLPDRRS